MEAISEGYKRYGKMKVTEEESRTTAGRKKYKFYIKRSNSSANRMNGKRIWKFLG